MELDFHASNSPRGAKNRFGNVIRRGDHRDSNSDRDFVDRSSGPWKGFEATRAISQQGRETGQWPQRRGDRLKTDEDMEANFV